MDGLSPALLKFLRDRISSYEELEALLILARNPRQSWSAAEIAEVLQIPTDACESALARLVTQADLITKMTTASTLRVRLAPTALELTHVLEELSRAYSEQRLAIVQLMSANALDRVRGAAARRLAEGFRIERPKK